MGNQSSQIRGQRDGKDRNACVTAGLTLRDKGFAALERDFQIRCNEEPNHAVGRPSQQLEDTVICRPWPAPDDINGLNDVLLHA